MDLSPFDYELPPNLIAQFPVDPRDQARLLFFDRTRKRLTHHAVRQIPDLLPKESLLIFNDTKVIPARLTASTTKRSFEIFLLKKLSEIRWKCLIKPSIRYRGEALNFAENVTAHAKKSNFFWEINFSPWPNGWLDRNGSVPIPPYLKRKAIERDKETYQTVFARHQGSVACPTAGLHFTEDLLKAIEERGVQIAYVTLEIGYGTFSPIQEEHWKHSRLHPERFEVPKVTQDQIEETRRKGGKIIAVGTTTVRALESQTAGITGETELFIQPGYRFGALDGLVTNFHLPRSSLYVLVASYLGLSQAQELYQTAIEKSYRFYSYGDAMAAW